MNPVYTMLFLHTKKVVQKKAQMEAVDEQKDAEESDSSFNKQKFPQA
jgi:hypothetical protein